MSLLRLFGLGLCLFVSFKFVQRGEVGLFRWRVSAVAAGVVVKSAVGDTFSIFGDVLVNAREFKK